MDDRQCVFHDLLYDANEDQFVAVGSDFLSPTPPGDISVNVGGVLEHNLLILNIRVLSKG